MVDGLVVQVLSRDDLLNDLLLDLLPELLSGDILAVLSRHDNGVDALRDNGASIVSVLNGDLGLGIGPEPRQLAALASIGHGLVQLVRKNDGQGQQFGGLVGGIAEHDTLVTSAELLKSLFVVETLGNVRRLLLNGDQHVAGLVVEALVGAIVANFFDGATNDLLVVKLGLGGDLTKDHDHTGLGGSLASDLGERVLGKAGIEYRVTDLVGDLEVISVSLRP